MGIPQGATVFKGGHSCDSVEVCLGIAKNLAKYPTHKMTLLELRKRARAQQKQAPFCSPSVLIHSSRHKVGEVWVAGGVRGWTHRDTFMF
jgi:hypothetical protein